MSLMDISHNSTKLIHEKAPLIFLGTGIGFGVATVVFGIAATPKAYDIYKGIKEDENLYELDKKEVVKREVTEIVPLYLPMAITGVASVSCLIASYNIHANRLAAMTTLYSVTARQLASYRNRIREELGNRKADILEAKADGDVMREHEIDIDPGLKQDGDMLCYDWLSGRYFYASPARIDAVENVLNRRLIQEMFINLNEMYDEFEISRIGIGDELGWTLDDEMISFTKTYDTAENGEVCLMLKCNVSPRYCYRERFY